jgi:hypothetical protein
MKNEWIFTFGHVHPEGGWSLDDHFVRIEGTHAEARDEMVRRFGLKWAEKWRLREIIAPRGGVIENAPPMRESPIRDDLKYGQGPDHEPRL